jgi:hypothetical protein
VGGSETPPIQAYVIFEWFLILIITLWTGVKVLILYI